MTEQQITEFDRWFEQRMDPELNLTPGDKELCRHAWKAALSHAEWEAQPDYVLDALDNLIHDNYERSYRGAKNRQDDAELIRCALRRSHPAPQVAVPEKVRELIGAVRSVNRSRQHSIHIEGDDEPCFWQRAEWVRYVLELADEAEQTITAAPTAPAGEQDPLPVGLSLGPLTDLIHEMDKLCQATPVDFADAVDGGYVDAGVDLHDKIIAECRRLAGMKRQQPVSNPDGLADRVLMPRALTAENGAKTALMGEFTFSVTMTCPECHPDDPNPDCEVCSGSVEYEQPHTVPWTTIKRIYSAAVDLLSAPAPDEKLPSHWAAVDADGEIAMSWSTDDGNNGGVARQECNDWINRVLQDEGDLHHLVPLYRSGVPVPDERGIAALREDAERYRFWLEVLAGDEKAAMDLFEEELNRDVAIGNRPPTGEELDKAVDVARRLRAGKEGE